MSAPALHLRDHAVDTAHKQDDDGRPKAWKATPYVRRDPTTIQPRDLLFGSHFLRRYVGITAGAGGVSKSMRSLIDAVSMTIGRDLLGRDRIYGGPKRVWLMNLEDDRIELERRIEAICLRFNVTEGLAGLFIDTGRERRLTVANETQVGVLVNESEMRSISIEMLLRRIDVLIIDPFVESHEVTEGANDSLKVVMSAWRQLAHNSAVAIDLVHHIRKNGGNDASIDDVRGGSSMVQAARSVRLISPMSTDDARALGIEAKDRRRYVSCSPWSKSNFAPPIDQRDWFFLESITLGNGTADYPEGDRIGVPAPWSPPGPLEGLTLEDCREIRALAASQLEPASTARVHTAAGGWFGKLVAQRFDIDVSGAEGRTRVSRVLAAMVRERWLAEGLESDSRREKRPVYLPHPESAER